MTREQIERLAEKINGKWPGVAQLGNNLRINWTYDDEWVSASPIYFMRTLNGHPAPDRVNAEWCIFCLDRLEELGGPSAMMLNVSGEYTVHECGPGICVSAPTRAEALALALLKKLEEE